MTVKVVPKSRKKAEPEGPATPALANIDTSKLTFVGERAQVTVPVLQCELKRTIEGASSLTVMVHDSDLKFLNSDAIADAGTTAVHRTASRHSPVQRKANLHSEVVLDGLVFALTGLGLQPEGQVQAILEEDAVRAMRNTKPLTMSRGSVTRAQFIKRLFKDAGVPFVCPELDIKQRQETPREAETEKQKERKRKPGIAGHAKLTVKQVAIDSEQRQNLEDALGEAARLKAGHLPTLAMICAGIGENDFRKGGGGAHQGVFQSTIIPADQTVRQAHYFLVGGESFQAGGAIALAESDPTLSAGEIATRVEAGGAPAEFYGVYQAEAENIIDAFTGGDFEGLTGETVTYAKSYQFQRKKGETSWACARRLADEVNWYLFVEGGVGYFFSGSYLARSKPRMLVAPGADGISNVGFKVMEAPSHDDTITVTCDATLWQAPPGSVAEVEGYGPLDGRWIVTQIARPNMKLTTTTVTLGRPLIAKLEPAHELGTRSASGVKPDATILAKLEREHPELKAGIREVVAIILGKYALTITSTTGGTHVADSYHYQGRAVDLAGPNMDAIGTWIGENLTSQLTEGIHNPTLSVKDRKTVASSYWGAEIWAGHADHIHVAV